MDAVCNDSVCIARHPAAKLSVLSAAAAILYQTTAFFLYHPPVSASDSLSSAYFIPSVTTVSQNIDELAKRCFSMLMDLINKKSSVSSIIEQNIIARNSAKINI